MRIFVLIAVAIVTAISIMFGNNNVAEYLVAALSMSLVNFGFPSNINRYVRMVMAGLALFLVVYCFKIFLIQGFDNVGQVAAICVLVVTSLEHIYKNFNQV